MPKIDKEKIKAAQEAHNKRMLEKSKGAKSFNRFVAMERYGEVGVELRKDIRDTRSRIKRKEHEGRRQKRKASIFGQEII